MKLTNTTYMHFVSMEVLVTIMNCSQSKLGIKIQLMRSPANGKTITRTAADTEVLLSFARDPDQASTAAPLDDERDLFGREEALRMDEEIMDFQCEHVTWDSIKDLRGTTYVQLPTRYQVCITASTTCHPTCHHSQQPSSLASEPAWKALVLSSWLLLGRLAVKRVSEPLCTLFGCTMGTLLGRGLLRTLGHGTCRT